MIAVIIIGGLFVSYRYLGKGVTYNGNEIIINIKNFVTTIPLSEVPSLIKTYNVNHKQYDTYYELSSDEQIIYNALLKKSKDVLINDDNDLVLNISLGNLNIGLDDNKTYKETEELIKDSFNKIDFNKVLNSLRADYPYYFWYLYSSTYSYSEPRIIIKGNDISNTYFQMELSSLYADDGEIDLDKINKARTCYKKAKEIANSVIGDSAEEKIKYFVDYILENTNYYNEYLNDADTDTPWNTFISVFDENPDTLSICGGYADALQLLCDLSEIECYTAMGYMNNDLHAWNEIYLDGQKYLMDATNLDEGTIGQGYKLYMKQVEDNTYSIKIYDEYVGYRKFNLEELVEK